MYRLDGCDDSCHVQHGSEGDHDPVGGVVDGEEHGHESHHGQDEGLEAGVGNVVKHPPPEDDLDDCFAHPLHARPDVHVLLLKLVFNQSPTSCNKS